MLFCVSSCVHLQSVSLTQIPAKKSKKVETEAHKWIILGFTFDNDYLDEVVPELNRRCSNGKIQGVLTKDETVNYFIGLVMKQRVVVSGYCQKA